MKVISPSLSVYRIQISSVFSIFERVSGVFLTLFFLFYLYLVKMKVVFLNSYNFYYIFFLSFKSSFWSFMICGIFLFILLNLVYHISFGLRYIVWDSYGMENLNLRNLKTSVVIYLAISLVLLLVIFFMLVI